MPERLLELLEGSLRVVVVSTDYGRQSYFHDLLRDYPLYALGTRHAAGPGPHKARRQRSGHVCHACIVDASHASSLEAVELIRGHAGRWSFVFVGGRQAPLETYEAARGGWVALVDSEGERLEHRLCKALYDASIATVLRPYCEYPNAKAGIVKAVRALHMARPLSVIDWATLLGVTPACLRKLWGEGFAVSPKDMVQALHVLDTGAAVMRRLTISKTPFTPEEREHARKVRRGYLPKRERLDGMRDGIIT